jgi:membrane-associated phospholipid phosphatase
VADVTLGVSAAPRERRGNGFVHALLSPLRWLEAHPVKGPLFGGYLVALYIVMRQGIFYDRERLFPWLFVGVAILVAGTGWRRMLELVLYWIPFAFLWVAYDLVRGLADNNRFIHTTAPISLEKFLFFGHVPNNELQDRFYVPQHIQWWEVITSLTYMSHFFVVYVTAAVLFVRSRDRFVRWMTALVLLTVLGVLGYFLYPMAPPWMAANNLHLIPDLARPGTRGLRLLHLTFVDRLWHHGANNSEMVNPVAAMPSLHAAYAMLFTLFFAKRTRQVWVKVLLALYPLIMAFTLVFGGEHYMIDIFAGWILAIIAVQVSDRFHDWRAARALARDAGAGDEPRPEPVAV